jgi:hypothetical protein
MQMFLFGGTASKSNTRLLIPVTLSIIGTSILWLLVSLFSSNAYEKDGAALKLLALGIGLFLSQNWIPFGVISEENDDGDRTLQIQWSRRRSAALIGVVLSIVLGVSVLFAPSLWQLGR